MAELRDVDLDTCAQEPIHLSGAVQPRGLLIVVTEADLVIRQISANAQQVVGVPAEAALGQHLSAVMGDLGAATVQQAVRAFGDLRERNPHETFVGDVVFDVILHRGEGGLLLVELERAEGERPLSFANTYLAVRAAVGALNRAATLTELYNITAEAVRDLTGFDRVMVYRYDEDYNGEVVAEAKRSDLNSFLGLHYPATDIPAQARALYEKNWLRLIDDIGYTPAPILPELNPVTGAPLDLTFSTLRSVSPIHIEYLSNMGVGASMSISLLRDGRLWGLIACHHYSGPHRPAYGVRAASEFLGSTLSLRLIDKSDEDDVLGLLRAQDRLASLVVSARDEQLPLAEALDATDLLAMVDADAVVIHVGDAHRAIGDAPDRETADAIAQHLCQVDDVVASSVCLSTALPELGIDPSIAAGALSLCLPDGQYILWLRAETLRDVDWGGDPHNKAIAVQEADTVRLSPRKSFARWSETVRGRSMPWTAGELDLATQLRRHLLEALYARAAADVRLAESVQRSLLPGALPDVPGWSLSAHYEPAAGGRIGGDWYDAVSLPDGKLAVVLGDVAGHGVGAAGKMAQLRNALRAYLALAAPLAVTMERLNDYVSDLMPGVFATALVLSIDAQGGTVEVARAGHPNPVLVSGAGAEFVRVEASPPLGVPVGDWTTHTFEVPPGHGLVLFSDGLIERKGEDIDAGLHRIQALLELENLSARSIFERVPSDGRDDVTVVSLLRE